MPGLEGFTSKDLIRLTNGSFDNKLGIFLPPPVLKLGLLITPSRPILWLVASLRNTTRPSWKTSFGLRRGESTVSRNHRGAEKSQISSSDVAM